MGSCASTGVNQVESPQPSSHHLNLMMPSSNSVTSLTPKGFSPAVCHESAVTQPMNQSALATSLVTSDEAVDLLKFGNVGHDVPLRSKGDMITDAELDNKCVTMNISPSFYKNMASTTLGQFTQTSLDTDTLQSTNTPESLRACYVRMRYIYEAIEQDRMGKATLLKNLHYAILVMESTYVSEKRRIREEEDELSESATEYVPDEVRDWLATTFTRSASCAAVGAKKPRFRSVANAIRAGIVVERIYRRMSSCATLVVPPNVLLLLKAEMDKWSFDVFSLNESSDNHALKFVGYELLHKYDLINKFQIQPSRLENLLIQLEIGYSKYSNPYHNLIHAADVMQTCHTILQMNDLRNWLTDLDIFAVLIAAMIHDYEHTGTTNNFHISTSSHLALVYNDRCVLENHHVSAIFQLVQDDDFQIFSGLDKIQYREFRQLVIEMVISTDMSLHFQQIKNMKSMLAMPESVDKIKALSLIVHCADIAHPAKNWVLHERWTNMLCEEFFRQGDREKELGLAISPLCDRNNVVIPQSQIGFIDFIVEPSFQVLGDMIEHIINQPLAAVEGTDPTEVEDHTKDLENETKSLDNEAERANIPRPWLECFAENKANWANRASEAKS